MAIASSDPVFQRQPPTLYSSGSRRPCIPAAAADPVFQRISGTRYSSGNGLVGVTRVVSRVYHGRPGCFLGLGNRRWRAAKHHKHAKDEGEKNQTAPQALGKSFVCSSIHIHEMGDGRSDSKDLCYEFM
jgi:hypothetical protein